MVDVETSARATAVRFIALDDAWGDAYDAFLAHRSDGMLYYTRRYARLLMELTGCRMDYELAVIGDAVVGVMPVMALDGPFGTVLNSLPYYGSHGAPIAETHEIKAALAARYEVRARDPGVACATMIENPFALMGCPPSHDLVDERISQITRLEAPERMIARIQGSARRNVKRTRALGIEVKLDHEMLHFLYATHCANMREIGGRMKEERLFALIPDIFRAGEDWDLYVATLDGMPLAALLVFYNGDTVEYFTPVTVHDARPLHPMAAILAQAMGDAWTRGFRRWNWGGSWPSQLGVRRFKQKWAAEEQRYRYFVTLNDRSLLTRKGDELLAAYSGFYTVPFSSLASNGPLSADGPRNARTGTPS